MFIGRVVWVLVLGLTAVSDHLYGQSCSQWDVALGQPGMDGIIYVLAPYQGDLIAGGAFVNAGGTEVRSIARWNGSQWLPFAQNGYVGVGFKGAPGDVGALTEFNGDLVVGGYYGFVGGGDFHSIARWDGSWHPF